MSSPTVFVCGITGTQGGAVARALLSRAVPVHAVARDPSSKNATAMAYLGAKLWPGDYDDGAALRSALRGCSAVFLNLSPDFTNPGAELRLAKAIMAAARDEGVNHLVYSSGLSVNAPERLPHWDPQGSTALILLSKQAIEREVRAAGFPRWTVLRPGNFMANFLDPLVKMYAGLVEHGRWSTALRAGSVLPMADALTIGNFASEVILRPDRFHAQEVEIADEFLVLGQLMPKLSAVAGRDLQAVYMSDDEVDEQKKTNPMVAAMLIMRDLGIFVDLEKVKSWGVPLSSFDAFLEREKKRVLETYQKAP
ncbi:NmrA-like family domain-containing protein [Tolypocladium paradoxum]|uniref:NmrA-like family domain-containing protein n=1 Tax=Tolypocladium paradoxum TaxID=94208 RepID=A0A2S4KVM8_9HYPO|nr:NmrA-like family domain-containing protein [Tolypocladium paradoxum]